MWYKRYGYKGPRHSGAERFRVLLAIPVVIVIYVSLAAFFRSPWPLLLIIPCSVVALEFMHRATMDIAPRFRENRKSMHIGDAINAYEMGNVEAAKESIRKAAIYGELSEEAERIKNKIKINESP